MGFPRYGERRVTVNLQEASYSDSILVTQKLGRDIDCQETREALFHWVEYTSVRHPRANLLRG